MILWIIFEVRFHWSIAKLLEVAAVSVSTPDCFVDTALLKIILPFEGVLGAP